MNTGRIILSLSIALSTLLLSCCFGGYNNTGKKEAALPTDSCHMIIPAQRSESIRYSARPSHLQLQQTRQKALQKDYLKQGCA